MKAIFKYPRVIDGAFYQSGVTHDLPGSMADHWFFKGLVEEKSVEVLPEEAPPKEEPKSKKGK